MRVSSPLSSGNLFSPGNYRSGKEPVREIVTPAEARCIYICVVGRMVYDTRKSPIIQFI